MSVRIAPVRLHQLPITVVSPVSFRMKCDVLVNVRVFVTVVMATCYGILFMTVLTSSDLSSHPWNLKLFHLLLYPTVPITGCCVPYHNKIWPTEMQPCGSAVNFFFRRGESRLVEVTGRGTKLVATEFGLTLHIGRVRCASTDHTTFSVRSVE